MADNVVDSLAIEIEANASQSVDGIKRLSRALTSLAASTAKVNSAGLGNVVSQVQRLSSATTSAGTGATNASNGTRKYSNALNLLTSSSGRAEKSTKSLAYYFGKIYANCFLAIRGFKAIGNAVNSAMDYIEAFNFFDVAISTAVAKGDDWANAGYQNAQEYATAFKQGLGNLNEKMTGFSVNSDTGDVAPSSKANLGINITDLETFESEIVSVTSSLGLATQASYDTSKGLTMLAADMSSLHNIDLKTVMQNFQSGIIGQSRALYKYGIDITNATLATYAYKYGVSKSVSEMTQAEKMQLRMLAILDQSKVAWGDLANTINQPANQLRVFTSGVKNLAITIGKLLLPIVSAVLPYLNAMVKALQRFFTWIANIAGIKLDAGNAGVGTSDIFDGIEDSADKANTSVGNLTNSVKELNKQLAPFDELNNMTTSNPSSGSNSGSGSGGSGGTVDLTDEINKALANYEKAWDEAYANMNDKATAMADTIVDAFKRKDYKGIGTYISNGLTNALNSIPWKTIYSVASEFGSGFAEFLNGLIKPDLFEAVGKTIAGALNTAVYNSLAFSTTFDWSNFGKSIANGVNVFFENFDFKALAETINAWIKGIETLIATTIANVNWGDVFKGIGEFIGNLNIDSLALILGTIIIKSIGGLNILPTAKKFIIDKIGEAIMTSAEEAVASGTATSTFTAIAGTILKGIGAGILVVGVGMLMDYLVEWLGNELGKTKEDIENGKTRIVVGGIAGAVIGAFITGITGGAGIIIVPIATAIGEAVGGAFGLFLNDIETFCGNVFENIKTWVSDKLTSVKDAFLNYDWGNPFEALSNLISDSFSAIGEKIGEVLGNVVGSIITFFTVTIPEKLTETIGSINIGDLAYQFGEMLGNIVGNGIQFLESIDWASIPSKMLDFIGTAFQTIFVTIPGTIAESIKKFYSSLFDSFTQKITDLDWNKIGQNILEGIIWIFTAPERIAQSIADAISNFFKGFKDGICNAFGIHSPAKEMKPLGVYILEGIVEGFTSAVGEFTDAVKDFFNNHVVPLFSVDAWKEKIGSIKDAMSEKWKDVTSWWDSSRPNLKEIKTTIENVKNRVSGAWNNVKTYWNSKPSLGQIKTTVDNFVTSVREKWNNVVSYWSGKSSLRQVTTTVENFSTKVREKWNNVTSYWNSKSSLRQITASVGDFVASVRDKWNNLYSWWSGLKLPSLFANIKLPHLSVNWHNVGKISVPSFDVEYYAKGGFPDIGTTFVAGEAGAEMVGNINGKTGVASNQEITGIRDAVYNAGEAQLVELREQNALLRQLLSKDMGISARDVFNAVRQEDQNFENMTGHSAFAR